MGYSFGFWVVLMVFFNILMMLYNQLGRILSKLRSKWNFLIFLESLYIREKAESLAKMRFLELLGEQEQIREAE